MGKKALLGWVLLCLLCTLAAPVRAADQDAALLAAVRSGDSAGVEALLQRGAAVDYRDVWGKSLLGIAAARADIVTAQLLLAYGADINARDNWGRTPLITAVQASGTWLTDILIHRGAAVNQPASNGITALVAAAQRGNAAAAAMLISAGAKVDHRDAMGWTPLMWAARRGDGELVAQLLAAGADINAADRQGRTVHDQAAQYNYPGPLSEFLRSQGALPGDSVPPETPDEAAVTPASRMEYAPITAGCASRGSPAAAVTIVEYTDFQCPYCGEAAAVVETVLKKYPGQVRLVLKHYPLEFHPLALPAAVYFEAVHRQSPAKAWLFYDRVFREQDRLSQGEAFLRQVVLALGVNLPELAATLADPVLKTRIAADIREADGFGLDGVPVFIINGRLLDGAQPLEEFSRLIEDALSAKR